MRLDRVISYCLVVFIATGSTSTPHAALAPRFEHMYRGFRVIKGLRVDFSNLRLGLECFLSTGRGETEGAAGEELC
ncbi:hypothetical protein M413DRAFT_444242 [Hebeloma cylindrosporum]|uniref:Uncharacterized protein n=1 Tax=Hebeloma cylindrosporum TaxID=76867 RepID=A0A0C3C0T7_HEBCY|nr:hypothetical protein M413DRAFT_444242 [Hebeloma cylindrosporum h7]